MNRIILFGAIVLGTTFSGCSTLDGSWKKHLPWSAEKKLQESKVEGPSKLVAIWTPDILTQPGKPPTRGFGGRLYFYNNKSQAIPVEGQLVVFAYDDSESKHADVDPERKYAFTPEQFANHFGKSDLGPSYSVWIPWDAVGGQQKNISLVPVFTASSGQMVMGEQALNVLPGRSIEKPEMQGPAFEVSGAPPSSNIQPVSHLDYQYVAPVPSNFTTGNPVGGTLRTSTIPVPRSVQARLMQPTPQFTEPPVLPVPTWPPTEGNWGAVQTTTQIIREPAPAASPNVITGQPVSASTPEASPAATSKHLLSNRSARSKPPARSWRDGSASPFGDPTQPFHAGPLSAPRPASARHSLNQSPGVL